MTATEEKAYLRGLAETVAGLAAEAENLERYERIDRLNRLVPGVPPVFIYPPAQAFEALYWPDGLETTDPALRGLEMELLRRIHARRVLGDDAPVSNRLYTGFFDTVTPWMEGYRPVRIGENLEAARFQPCLLEYGQLEQLREPVLTLDAAATERQYQRIAEVLGDSLEVVKGRPYYSPCGWGESMIDQLVEMRGLEQLYYDMIDEPDWVCRAMELMTRGKLRLLEACGRAGMLVSNNCGQPVGSSSPGYCTDLPLPGAGPTADERGLWGFAQAQELSGVSGEMLERFVLPYQARLLNRFGLACYGCCEAMEDLIELAAKYLPNLRMVSISPFAHAEKAAEKCRGRFVYAWKPQPAHFVNWDVRAMEEDLRHHLRSARGCCVTISLMDIYRYGDDPGRFAKWVTLARRAVDACYRG